MYDSLEKSIHIYTVDIFYENPTSRKNRIFSHYIVKVNSSIVVLFCLREPYSAIEKRFKDRDWFSIPGKHTEVSFRSGVPMKWAISCENRSLSRRGTTERARERLLTDVQGHRCSSRESNRICVSRIERSPILPVRGCRIKSRIDIDS